MEHTTYASRLRYLAAADVDDTVVDYDGLDVEGPDGGRIGDVAGFIVDAQAGRLHYVVVDSGGWFRSRRFLLPVGHANLSGGHAALRVDVTRDALSRYPAFDEDHFSEFSDDDLKVFEQRMVSVCCPEDSADERYGLQRHYAQPDWWTASAYAHERLRPVDMTAVSSVSPPPVRDQVGSEQVRAHSMDAGRGDVSPHYEGRAQPGDVIGIETGGERSYVGDTAEDENRRRRIAERAIGAEDDEPRRSER
jgi:hypothetical protein